MNALVLNGAHERDAALDSAHASLVDILVRRAWHVESFVLRDIPLKPCRGCFGCWQKEPGLCLNDSDAGRTIARKMVQSELMVMLTPVTFGGYSSHLKKALDRLIGNLSPMFTMIDGETHHKRRYKRYPALVALGMMPSADEESEQIFRTLVRRNAINMHSPACSAGVVFESLGPEEMEQRIRHHLAETGVEV